MLCLCETVICDMRQKKKEQARDKNASVTSQKPPWALVLLTTEHKGICLRKKRECFQSLATNDLYLETIPDKQSLQLVFHECHRSGSLIKCKWTSKKVCLSRNHTQGYLLVNIFIVVFPFKIWPRQNKNKKTKQNKINQRQWPQKNAQFVLVYSTEILLLMGVVLLVSAISEGKKILPFWSSEGRCGCPR